MDRVCGGGMIVSPSLYVSSFIIPYLQPLNHPLHPLTLLTDGRGVGFSNCMTTTYITSQLARLILILVRYPALTYPVFSLLSSPLFPPLPLLSLLLLALISLFQGFIDIKLVVNVQADTASKEKHVFNVMTADRTYVLQATSEDEVNYWYAPLSFPCLFLRSFSLPLSNLTFIASISHTKYRITGLNAIISNLSQPLATLINKAELFVSNLAFFFNFLPQFFYVSTSFNLYIYRKSNSSCFRNNDAQWPLHLPNQEFQRKTSKHDIWACDFPIWQLPKKAKSSRAATACGTSRT